MAGRVSLSALPRFPDRPYTGYEESGRVSLTGELSLDEGHTGGLFGEQYCEHFIVEFVLSSTVCQKVI